MKLAALAVVMGLAAGPALADTTAVYEAPAGGSRVTVQVNDAGEVRAEMADKPGTWLVFRKGEAFVVFTTGSGLAADRLSDVTAVLVRIMAEQPPLMKELGAAMLGDTTGKPFLKPGGPVTIGGRPGIAYVAREQDEPSPQPPVVVISRDPALAPIGAAMARQFEMSAELTAAVIGGVPPQLKEIGELMKTGAPLQFAGAQLTTVSNAPLPASTFDLPGPPETRAAIEKRIRAKSATGDITAF